MVGVGGAIHGCGCLRGLISRDVSQFLPCLFPLVCFFFLHRQGSLSLAFATGLSRSQLLSVPHLERRLKHWCPLAMNLRQRVTRRRELSSHHGLHPYRKDCEAKLGGTFLSLPCSPQAWQIKYMLKTENKEIKRLSEQLTPNLILFFLSCCIVRAVGDRFFWGRILRVGP